MISRIWHGYTTFDNADEYENLLKGKYLLVLRVVKSKDTKEFSY